MNNILKFNIAIKIIVIAVIATFNATSYAKEKVIDRSSDSFETIKLVSQEYVKSEFPGQMVNFIDFSISYFVQGKEKAANGKGEIQSGGHNPEFRVGNGPIQIKKLQLAKLDDKWQVVNELTDKQIHSAHRLTAPLRDEPPWIFKKIAARHFEKHFYIQKGGWKKIKEPLNISCWGGKKKQQIGICEVGYGTYYIGKYKINDSYRQAKCSAKTYLFSNINGEWVVDKIFPSNKKVYWGTIEIKDRTRNDIRC